MKTTPLIGRPRFFSLFFSAGATLLLLSLAQSVAAQEPTDDDRVQARALLNQGVEAYKNGQFDQAIADFQRAKELDPSFTNAQLYLATAYASEYVPGAPSEANRHYGELAVQEFKEILQRDPENLPAIDGIGSILYNMAGAPYDPDMLQESKTYHEKHIEIKPDDPEPYYWVGVVDWSLAFRANKQMRDEYNQTAKAALPETEPMPPDLAPRFALDYGAVVQEGIDRLNRAMDLRPDYDDAMAYLNLLYRQKADMETSDAAREDDLKMADDLVDRVKDIKTNRNREPDQN